jgi:hypothetical protein
VRITIERVDNGRYLACEPHEGANCRCGM